MIVKNFLTGEDIFFSKSRGSRPHNFAEKNVRDISTDKCPFCPENEFMTPKKLYESQNGRVRVVLNKYPFLEESAEYASSHEVVIDTPVHNQKIDSYSREHLAELMQALKKRQAELENNIGIEYVQIFKNNGASAGASQPHSHWQITALPLVPERITRMLAAFSKYRRDNNEYYFWELNERYAVDNTEYFRIFCPYDSKFAYEMDITGNAHFSSIKYMNDKVLEDLGIAVQKAIKRLIGVCGRISFNICFYSAPAREKENSDFVFFAQIIPRIGNMAGFEFASDCFINSVYPENAAELFRNYGELEK